MKNLKYQVGDVVSVRILSDIRSRKSIRKVVITELNPVNPVWDYKSTVLRSFSRESLVGKYQTFCFQEKQVLTDEMVRDSKVRRQKVSNAIASINA